MPTWRVSQQNPVVVSGRIVSGNGKAVDGKKYHFFLPLKLKSAGGGRWGEYHAVHPWLGKGVQKQQFQDRKKFFLRFRRQNFQWAETDSCEPVDRASESRPVSHPSVGVHSCSNGTFRAFSLHFRVGWPNLTLCYGQGVYRGHSLCGFQRLHNILSDFPWLNLFEKRFWKSLWLMLVHLNAVYAFVLRFRGFRFRVNSALGSESCLIVACGMYPLRLDSASLRPLIRGRQ